MAVLPARSWSLFRKEFDRRPRLAQWFRALGICCKDPTRLLEALCPWIFKQLRIPFILLDRGDHPNLNYPNFYAYVHACAVFMREMPLNRFHAFSKHYSGGDVPLGPAFVQKKKLDPNKLMPISIGIPDQTVARISSIVEHLPSTEKKYDLTFIGSESSWERRRVKADLEKIRTAGYRVFLGNRLPFSEYVEILAVSWLVLSPPGNADECWRHYEIPLAGSVPLLAVPTIFRQAPLQPNVEAIYYFPDAGDFHEVVTHALGNKEKLSRIARQGALAVRRSHAWSRQRDHILQTAFSQKNKVEGPD